MPIITFWSNNEKAIGQTVATSLAATAMAMEHNYKVLLISVDFNNTVIENCFGAQQTNKEILKTLVKSPQINLDSGINGLLKLADSNRITPEIIHDYTKIIFKNRLEILYSPMNIFDNQEKLLEQYKNIIINASRYYDQVFIDLKKGMKHSGQLQILEMSDVIVANVNQDMKIIENLVNMKEVNHLSNKIIWNICKYDKNSKYNSKNLVRTILKRQVVCETHYNTLVAEAAQEGNVAELMLRFRTLKEEDDNKLFITKLKELTEAILVKCQEIRTKR